MRELGSFLGLDCAGEASRISARRMARCLNMWRDYESESGGAIETMPGWRRLVSGSGRVNGVFGFRSSSGVEYLALHVGKNLYRIPVSKLDSLTSLSGYLVGTVSDSPSVFFESGGYCYLLDGG